MEQKRPGVGVSVIILNENKILMGKRRGSHGAGSWAFPGGHIEMYGGFEETCKREVKEETDLDIELIDKTPIAVTNDFFKTEDKHYVTLFFRAKALNLDQLKIMEPDRCEEWNWFTMDNLPKPLFICNQNLLKQDFNPFE